MELSHDLSLTMETDVQKINTFRRRYQPALLHGNPIQAEYLTRVAVLTVQNKYSPYQLSQIRHFESDTRKAVETLTRLSKKTECGAKLSHDRHMEGK